MPIFGGYVRLRDGTPGWHPLPYLFPKDLIGYAEADRAFPVLDHHRHAGEVRKRIVLLPLNYCGFRGLSEGGQPATWSRRKQLGTRQVALAVVILSGDENGTRQRML